MSTALHGRDNERARIDTLLVDARAGRSNALVIRGEPGAGKSALLRYAARSASDMPVLRGRGIEPESQLPFAGLHLLLHGQLDRLVALPRPQADALRCALGMQVEPGVDRFHVGLAVLSLLAEVAGDGPALCLIDDAQWLDPASADALLFAARRLLAEGIVLILAARDPFPAPGLSELRLPGLDHEAQPRTPAVRRPPDTADTDADAADIDAADAERLAVAAESAAQVGEHGRATSLVEQAESKTRDLSLRARFATVRGRASFAAGDLPAAYRHLHAAVTLIKDDQPHAALWLLMEMMYLTYATGDVAGAAQTADALDALALPDADQLVPIRRLLRWVIYRQVGRDVVDLPPLPDTVRASLAVDTGDLRRRLFVLDACLVGGDSVEIYHAVDDLVATIRARGAVGLLPAALTQLGYAQAYRGRHRDARATASEAVRIAEATGQDEWISQASSVLALLAALEGDEQQCRSCADVALASAQASRGSPGAYWALGLLDLGLGRVGSALDRLEVVARGPARFQIRVMRSAPDLVEAAVRADEPARAADALARFEQWACHSRQPWMEALLLRCYALLAPDDKAELHYVAALEAHETDRPVEAARTALLYGEWLRRVRRRTDARIQLRAALDVFERLGMHPWAERARGELRATGEAVPIAAAADLLDLLTPQELQVVRLAAAGLSNRAIGARLFLSPRTVGYHLYKAYPKLGVASRTELAGRPGLRAAV